MGRVSRGRRVAFLGDMLELGPRERELHAGLAGVPALAAVTTVHCAGPRMRALYEALPAAQRGEWFEDAEAMAARGAPAASTPATSPWSRARSARGSGQVVEAIKRMGEARPAEALEG